MTKHSQMKEVLALPLFILNAMLSTEEIIGNLIPSTSRNLILNSIKKSAFFIFKYNESHGIISNHLAGAALALLKCSILLESVIY